MPFKFNSTPIQGLMVIEPRAFSDDRGFFMESYKASDFIAAGITVRFVQDNHSRSCYGTLRGLHFQKDPHAQGKLVRVTQGKAWDVAVDLRAESSTFGKWHVVELSAENKLLFWIPEGFAHGFVALEDGTELQYKCTGEYAPESDSGIIWNDLDLAIEWPIKDVVISPKDMKLQSFADYKRSIK
jgi:dTDP-4-dehydrorhamnose 3,5-epimerase